MLDMAVEYAKVRQQFGKPIGTQQAVKHLLANAAIKVEFARPLVYRAAYEHMNGLLGYLTENCCQGATCAVEPASAASC